MDNTNDTVVKYSLQDLRENMVLAKDVLNTWGAVLLPKGTVLAKDNFSRLTLNSVRYVYIDKSSLNYAKDYFTPRTNSMPELIVERVEDRPEFKEFQIEYNKKTDVIKSTLIDIGNGANINLKTLFSLTNGIMEKLKFKNDLLVYMGSLKSTDEHTFTHSNNVSLLCNLFASWMKMNEENTLYLTTAGILHDVGKTLIDQKVLNKRTPLTNEEFELIKRHTTLGYNILKNHEIPKEIKLAALMHHERIDGTGYPLGVPGSRISSYAKMVAICDIYDAMTANRPYRKKICPFNVIKQFEQRSYGEIDIEYLLVFLQNIAYTYVSSYVELSDGRHGQIVYINVNDLSRPMVRVEDTVIDLKIDKHITIESIL